MVRCQRASFVSFLVVIAGCTSSHHAAAHELSIVMSPQASIREELDVEKALSADRAEVSQVRWADSAYGQTIHLFPGTSAVTTPPASSSRVTLRPTANAQRFIRRFGAMPGVERVTLTQP